MSATPNNTVPSAGASSSGVYQGIEVSESKFWRKLKKDPVVPIGMAGFGLIVIGAIVGFNRRDRNKPTSTYWIRTRVFAQGFVVSLMTAAAIYHAVKDNHEPHDIHGHPIGTQNGSAGHHQHHHQHK